MLMSKRPLITVVTVTYNAENLVERTINSVAQQRFSDYEYILIDGASEDNTLKAVNKHRKFLDKVISEPDNGIYEAMNKAVRMSRGEWICFMNAGDQFYDSSTLQYVSEQLQVDTDLVYGDRCRVSEDGTFTHEKAGELENTFIKEVVYHQALFTRTKLLKDRPYNENYKIAADYEFLLYCYTSGKRFFYIEKPIAKFLEGGYSRVNKSLAQIEALKAAFEYCPNELNLKYNYYYENFVVSSIGFYVNKYLQESKKQLGFDLHVESTGGNFQLFAENASNNFNQLLDTLNNILLLEARIDPKDIGSAKCGAESASCISNFNEDRHKSKMSYALSSINFPRIIVATVSYNAGNVIEKTIQSVIVQNYPNLEYIIVDGFSKDNTRDIIEKYRSKINTVIVEEDNGIYEAMNKAINVSNGDYILFLNAGDTFHDNQVVSRVFKEGFYSTDLVYGDRIYLKLDGSAVYQESKNLQTAYERMPYCHQSLFLKLDVAKKFRFDETYKYAADYDQCIRMYKAGCTYTKLVIPICVYAQGGESESGIRPYLESIKILFDNCEDKRVIRNNQYYSAFRRNASRLLEL